LAEEDRRGDSHGDERDGGVCKGLMANRACLVQMVGRGRCRRMGCVERIVEDLTGWVLWVGVMAKHGWIVKVVVVDYVLASRIRCVGAVCAPG
jgi:hypothetical protein